MTYYEALEAALDNLNETSVAQAQIGDGFYSAVTGDNYDSARILLKDKIESGTVLGDTFAMVPQRDALYVTGSDDNLGLEIMLKLTERSLEGANARPLCPIPLRYVDGEWEDWMVPTSHELFQQFKQLQAMFLSGVHADQKVLLDQLHEAKGIDIFVASYSVLEETTKEILTFCGWSDGVEALLPQTDLVKLQSGESETVICDSKSMLDVVGSLLLLDDSLYPARYHVREFPSREQVDRITRVEL